MLILQLYEGGRSGFSICPYYFEISYTHAGPYKQAAPEKVLSFTFGVK